MRSSLRKIDRQAASTVFTLMKSRAPMPSFESPSDRACSTSSSRSDSDAMPVDLTAST